MSDSDDSGAGAVSSVDENKLIAERRAKLSALRDRGQAFPNDFRRTAVADTLQRDFAEAGKEDLEARHEVFRLLGALSGTGVPSC